MHSAQMFRPHRTFGFIGNPDFASCKMLRNCKDGGGLLQREFHIDIGDDGFRRTPAPVHAEAHRKIWCMGCSFTFGFGVNDDAVYPALLAKRVPSADVRNFGVCGFSTYQAFLVLKEQLAFEKPDIVILGHLPAHVQRNIVSPYWMTQITGSAHSATMLNREGFWQPRAVSTIDEEIVTERVRLGDQYIHLVGRDIISPVHHHGYFILNLLLRDLIQLSEQYGFTLVIASLLLAQSDYDEAFARRVDASSAIWCDASLPALSEDYLCLPFDMHPNEAGHRHYASVLSEVLVDL
jgi:hypothetical protein